jgi:hypothetical protein
VVLLEDRQLLLQRGRVGGDTLPLLGVALQVGFDLGKVLGLQIGVVCHGGATRFP